MKHIIPSLAAMSFLAACITAPSVQGRTHQDYIPTVFDYSGLVLDLGRGQEGFAGRPRLVADCSTTDFHCVRGGNIFHLVTPRECSRLASGSLAAGGVATEVLGREDGAAADGKLPLHSTRPPVWLLGSAERPNTVYVYANIGVVGIYHDAGRRVDLVTLAREQGLDGLRHADHRDDGFYFRLTTFDSYGPCTGPF